MKFLVEIPDEHIEADGKLAEDFGQANSPEERIRHLLYEHFEFVTEVFWEDNPELEYPEIEVTRVEDDY